MNKQKGFGVVEIILTVIIVGVIGLVGWIYWDKNQSTDNNTPSDQQKTENAYSGWTSGEFKIAEVSYKLPPGWQDISDESTFQDEEFKYEELVIRSSDNFRLLISVHNMPRGFGYDPPATTVLEIKDLGDMGKLVVVDDLNGKVGSMYLSGQAGDVKSVGQKINVVNIVSLMGEYTMDTHGSYPEDVKLSLDEFNKRESVKQAKLILESLQFNPTAS